MWIVSAIGRKTIQIALKLNNGYNQGWNGAMKDTESNIKIKKLKFCHNIYMESCVEYHFCFGETLIDNKLELCLETNKYRTFGNISVQEYEKFCTDIDEITKLWRHNYKNKTPVSDGQAWNLNITFTNNKKTLYYGELEEPSNFSDLETYLNKFAGRFDK